ncbi:MAG: hypothetical protein JWM33_1776 [Caulobacteraceae bacterium]|nr:hypothetical protein [Caulobacteraceae bacterium]
MQIHIFKAADRTFGFTQDGAGANLPTQHGAWRPFKVKELVRGQGKVGFDVDQCLEDIDKHGFHLTRAKARVTEQAA